MARVRAHPDRREEPAGYGQLLEDLKSRIKGAQVRAALAANREMITLYWDIGRAIVERQEQYAWGASVIERLSRDLRSAFPDTSGFSPRNLWRMRLFYLAYARDDALPATAFEAGLPGQSVFLPRSVAELTEAITPASDELDPPEISPASSTTGGGEITRDSVLSGQSVILPRGVAEMSEVVITAASGSQPYSIQEPSSAIDDEDIARKTATSEPSVILSQSVAEMTRGITEGSSELQSHASLVETSRAIAGHSTAIDQRVVLPRGVAEMIEAPTSAASAVPNREVLPEPLASLPWGHNSVLLEKLTANEDRLWYARMSERHGWSRNVLVHQIETGLHRRAGQAVTNFDLTLPPADSDLARELLKDPYHFEFLPPAVKLRERDLEQALLSSVQEFLMELGVGFALMGNQYHLEVGGQDFYLDLLFYHVRLRRHVVVELKIGEFRPEDSGKMAFYLSAVDDLVRQPGDEPSIGLILCKERNRVVAEYALRGSMKPIGIAQFRLMEQLPEPLQASLPSVEELEHHLRTGAATPSRQAF